MARRAQKKDKEKDDGCRKVVSEYFEATGKAMEGQVKLYQTISKQIAEGKYTSEQAQKDWQECVERTTEYGQEVTKLWLQGLTRCAWSPIPFWFPGVGDLSGSDR